MLPTCHTRCSYSGWVSLSKEERQPPRLKTEWVFWRCYSKYSSIEMLLSATSVCFTMDFQVQKSFKTLLCYKPQSCSQTPRSSRVPRHTVSPEYPVPTVWKGFFCPGPHMYKVTKLARQFHPRHPTCQELKCHFPSDLQKFFLLSCSYRKKCLLYTDLLMIVAASIMGCSKIARSFEMILIGRFMCGISAGK